LKRTALPGGMFTSSPVRGLRPIPVLRGFTLKTEFDALAAAKSQLQRFEDSLNGLLGLGAADVRRGDDSIYDIELNHTILPRFRGRC
jgi:hypothetical protein